LDSGKITFVHLIHVPVETTNRCTETRYSEGDMDSAQFSTPQTSQPLPPSASSSDTTSPALSFFSKRHSARSGSSSSSIASSPALRDSLDTYSSSKRHLTDVKEEPFEREDADMTDELASHTGTCPSSSTYLPLLISR
jgi:hypothetical protein